LKLSQELLAHSHISTTADIYVHGRREAKAGKATELLASQFVPVFSEGARTCFGVGSVKKKRAGNDFPTQLL
jgi:hypothetical protein